jgi:hypothetical protein
MKSPINKAIGTMLPNYAVGFDSATAMVKALSAYLKGQDFTGAGVAPSSELLASAVNALPQNLKETIYIESGVMEALQPEEAGQINAEEFCKWVVNCYPERQYPAILVGSASGAMVHLAAALGIPWLPQTFLVSLKRPRHMHVDKPEETMEWATPYAEAFLRNNPNLQLHHMFDASQDRLMVSGMTYFRSKFLTLGTEYERFISKRLQKGGSVIIVDCQKYWPATRLGNRHYFQFGGVGGLKPEEFIEGNSQRVKDFLKKYNSPYDGWNPPRPDDEMPESEWGYESKMTQDIERFTKDQGFALKRLRFTEPDHLSPLVADLYRWWYKRRRIVSNRLIVESFILHEPYWALRTGSVPFWLKFVKEPSFEKIMQYLDERDAFDEIFMMLFSHGTESVGLVPIEKWKEVLAKAGKRGEFMGVSEKNYPWDFGSFVRFNTHFEKNIKSRYPLPAPLSLTEFESFLSTSPHTYQAEWTDRLRDSEAQLVADEVVGPYRKPH